MNLSTSAQATLLLTCYFSKANKDDVKPLTNGEWGRFALWLKTQSLNPADLLQAESQLLLQNWHDPKISHERILALLQRGHSLALALEKWQRAGLWVLTRADVDYPWRLKQRLKNDSPPVLFGCGNQRLLNAGGLAVVGSRHASPVDLAFAESIGIKAAAEGIAIVSGGARGVDETAMQAAAKSGGNVIGVMADSLLNAATSTKWRSGLMEARTVLISPFYPEATFHTGNAMARNKYIYCLAESALVVRAGEKGGTVSGAEENLKKNWVPLWVKPTEEIDAANAQLVARGGTWCGSDLQQLTISTLITAGKDSPPNAYPASPQADLFGQLGEETAQYTGNSADENIEPVDFYQMFLNALPQLAEKPVTVAALMALTGLQESQLNAWLIRATESGAVTVLTHPDRYQWNTP